MGFGHIASPHAEAIDEFYRQHFNPYLNFHRPCGVPEMSHGRQGQAKARLSWYATPWEILRQLPGVAGFLQPRTLTVDQLQQTAGEKSDTQAAREMQEAKRPAIRSLSP